jgi:hypothetical protein
MKPRLTAERLREVLRYAPATGRFFWRVRLGGAAPGREAGRPRPTGYSVISVDGIFTYAHRLAWLYVHGRHPDGVIDHINGDPSDNRIANLRDCTQGENRRNTRSRAISGFKGVYRSKKKLDRWYARIVLNKKPLYLGSYGSAQDAADMYDRAARHCHGQFALTNAAMRRAQRRFADSGRQTRFPRIGKLR